MILPSTRALIREARKAHHYSLFDFLHGWVYLRWPYFYIAVGTGEHRLARIITPLTTALVSLFGLRGREGRRDGKITFADTSHGKVVPLESAKQLVTVNRDVTLPDLEHIIPYERARDIVLKNPDRIAVLECPCRAAREHPCRPLDVCLIIGEPFAGYVLEHHRDRARRITQAEAIEILRQEDERGHVHHAFFKDAMLGRFYAICNCCKCCCGAMQAHRNGTPMLASSGYRAVVDRGLCAACGTCAKYCQFDAVRFIDGVKMIDGDRCMGCGVCVPKCPKKAVGLVRDPSRGEPLEISSLMADVIGDAPVRQPEPTA